MKYTNMFRLMSTTVLLAGIGFGAAAQDINVDALLERNENQARPAATEGDMKMIIVNKAGQERVREIKAYSKTEADGTTKQSLIFLSPADVRDTRFLTIDYKDPAKDDEQYIYIPALRKVRTIGTSGGESKTGAFLGSDFTFADIGALDRKDFSVKFLGPDSIGGRQYAKVEYSAKGPQVVKNYGYSKIVRWIDRENATTKQSEYYDASGKLVKRLVIQNQRLVDGKYWQFDAMEMQNLETGGKTVWQFVKTTILPSIEDKYFTVRFIERGR
ncbi:MAG: outer membrane lipoprotein-sorting protein [Treponemataceae bacterium]|nr:outer membrane lipoprotein-sorting protein [Treponemataceae bacterium]